MKMVAGARLTRAQQRIVAMRPYAVKTGEVLQSVARTMNAAADVARRAGAPAPGDAPGEEGALRGAHGRPRALRRVQHEHQQGRRARSGARRKRRARASRSSTLGRKGREYLARRGGKVSQDFLRIYDGLDLEKARLVAAWLVPRFQKAEFDAVYLVFNEFKSAITQKVVVESPPAARDAGGAGRGQGRGATPRATSSTSRRSARCSSGSCPMYVEISIYRALLESQASFFGAQMTAMDAATRNAKEMIARLTLDYNRARQAAHHQGADGDHRRRRGAQRIASAALVGGAEALNG